MRKKLDELYFEWLYSQVGSVKNKNLNMTYWSLLRQLYLKEFVFFISNDDNRAEDGKVLRVEFLDTVMDQDPTMEWMSLPCSMLEMILGLSRRLSFLAGGETRDWFWHLLENIDLDNLTDASYNDESFIKVDEVLNRVIFRTYDKSGKGGLFPLKKADVDQKTVEIWYQLNKYLIEQDLI